MFEGWLADLLAGYLGHFLDVKREQLRLSLWSGDHQTCDPTSLESATRGLTDTPSCCAAWSTGFVLQDVALKLDAFDYLQLPFAVCSGCIGRLEVQVSNLAAQAAFACTGM